MMVKLFKSRGARKFRRNKLAMVALGVIGLYFFVAVAVFFGVLDLRDCNQRVLPGRSYGFLQKPDQEKRFDELTWYVRQHLQPSLNAPGGLAQAPDASQRIEAVALAERTIVNASPADVDRLWQQLREHFDTLDDAWLEREDIRYEINDIEVVLDDELDPDERASLEAELADLQLENAEVYKIIAQAMPRVEAALLDLMPMPTGWGGLVYSFRTFLGSDESGRSVAVRSFYSIKIAFQVGLIASLMSVTIGTILGGLAGFYGRWVDHLVMWLVSTLSSVPYLVLLAVLIYIVRGNALFAELFDNPTERPGLALVPVYAAFGLTFWIGTCRVIRGEVMKIKQLEYVQAATAIGLGRFRILIKHVIPNTSHIMFINFSLIFIGAIKSEVILSFLGLGVKGQPSWGILISLGREDVQNFFFWTVLTATVLMFGLVLAFNIVSDALQDAFDPKHV
ncbi:MAG: ABC transporter permease [Phycisphaeraceae bacterium]|nr:ABC transporter permease [Phycisphaeraceae bacterium]MCW5762161.1 ABC transporter permease [Phycisphaeraceae bacterium]